MLRGHRYEERRRRQVAAEAVTIGGRWMPCSVGGSHRPMGRRHADTRFPLGIFVINVSGSFLLGVLATLTAGKAVANPEAVGLALGVGFLGAFTTFSTFELDTHVLLASGLWLTAAVNVIASVFVGLAAVRAGIVVARAFL